MRPVVVDRVISRTSRGCIFRGIDDSGQRHRFVVDRAIMPRDPIAGETWEIRGVIRRHATFGAQCHVRSATLERPSGRLIIAFLKGDRFPGVGECTARALWDEFGDRLADVLDDKNTRALESAVGNSAKAREQVHTLIVGWAAARTEMRLYRFLDRHGVGPGLAKRLLDCYGDDAVALLKENPYRLLSFTTWSTTDGVGRSMGVLENDPRRLVAAVEAAIYTRLGDNHTVTPQCDLARDVRRILGDKNLAAAAVSAAEADIAIISNDAGWQGLGPATMETYVAARLNEMIEGKVHYTPSLFQRTVDEANLRAVLGEFEKSSGIILNRAQREAVGIALLHEFIIVTGGAGVGKTTVLKAICTLAARLGVPVQLMALSGRAALRMQEATGRDAMTCAGWLHSVNGFGGGLEEFPLIVIDEASMIDLPLFYRILRAIQPGCRLIMVGDPGQLPPVGFGLTFHVFVEDPRVPQVHLTQVMRQAAETGIPQVGLDIREGRAPYLLRFDPRRRTGVSFVDAPKHEVVLACLDVLKGIGGHGDAQIVGSVKGTGDPHDGGTVAMNAALHRERAARGDEPLFGRFFVGEPIIHTINDYDTGLMNGSLGNVVGLCQDDYGRFLVCRFDGRDVKISEAGFDNLDLAFAITAHKAQGSQFPTVIVPVFRNKIMDRTMLYTAITRAQRRAILVGDRRAFEFAVTAAPSHSRRRVGLRLSQNTHERGGPQGQRMA